MSADFRAPTNLQIQCEPMQTKRTESERKRTQSKRKQTQSELGELKAN